MSDERIPPPLCVFCSAPWTDDMVKVLASAEEYSGYYAGDHRIEAIEVKIDATCSSCGRLVYRKEIRDTAPKVRDTVWGTVRS